MNSLQSTETASRSTAGSNRRGRFWMLVPLGLLVVSVSGWLYMVALAVDDPGFAVESDYYKKASNYDDVMAQASENSRLGWNAKVLGFSWLPNGDGRLTMRVTETEEQALKSLVASADAFPIARSKRVQSLQFEQQAPGIFNALLVRPRVGLWEVRVTLENAAGEKATAVLRPELSALAGAGRGEAARE